MTGWPEQPAIYEVNTAVWLGALSRAAGRLTLADVPASSWDEITPAGADAVWLMGVWERSPAGLALANADAGLQASFRDALPDLRAEDVIGSPYCVRRYVADAAFGGRPGLAEARAALAAHGVRLLLDYVPNHVAPDHPWVVSEPELFVRGDEHDLEAEPGSWVAAGGHVLAHGRDPYFPPWPDVVQLDAFSPAVRAATAGTLADIADQCDGIRCDMAMLMTNHVFAMTWGGRTGPEPDEEFWPAVIGRLRGRHPETVLVAEAYWDLEWELQQQGFDFCYDKRLYDRIVGGDATAVRDHLRADLGYQSRLLRFLENHDEPRIASRMPAAPAGPRPSPSRRCPVRPCGTKGSSRAAGCGHRSSSRGGRTNRWTPAWPAGTGGCWPRSPASTCGRANGGCWRPGAGPTTSPAATSSPGPGLVAVPVTAAVTGTWWWSTCPGSPRRDGSHWAGRTCMAAAGASRTCSGTRCSSVTATNWRAPGCSSTWRRGSSTCSPCGRDNAGGPQRRWMRTTSLSAIITTPQRDRDRRGEQELPPPQPGRAATVRSHRKRAGITPWRVTTPRDGASQDRVNRPGHNGSLETYC